MNDLFGSIFGLFQNIYGIPLSNFMYEDGRLYSQIGMAMVVVSIVVCAVFYYVINHPALNSWKGWGNRIRGILCIDFVFYKTQKCELFSLSPHKIKK